MLSYDLRPTSTYKMINQIGIWDQYYKTWIFTVELNQINLPLRSRSWWPTRLAQVVRWCVREWKHSKIVFQLFLLKGFSTYELALVPDCVHYLGNNYRGPSLLSASDYTSKSCQKNCSVSWNKLALYFLLIHPGANLIKRVTILICTSMLLHLWPVLPINT